MYVHSLFFSSPCFLHSFFFIHFPPFLILLSHLSVCFVSFIHPYRTEPQENVGQEIRDGMSYKQKFPDYYAGYDLVAQEDTGYSLLHYIEELLQPSQSNKPLPYFFHAGETSKF